MPGLSANATVSTTKEVRLAPKVRTKLLTEFRAYAALKAQEKAIADKLDTAKARIAALREDTGEMSLELDGFKTTLVAPIRKVFNPKLFVSNGGDLQVYNNSIEDVPSKAYELVTVPKG